MNVEIWSDIICPWCYIGKRRFETAIASFEGREDVQVTWRSFELDPTAPRQWDGDLAEHLAGKLGVTRETAIGSLRQTAELAAGEGLEYRFDLARGGNTFDAHRLVHLGAHHGIQDAVKERLMKAYFSEGEPIGDREVLQRLAVEAGLARDEAVDLLEGDRFAAAVRADEQTAGELGITGVPFFVVDRRYAASGAQAPETLAEMLRRALPEKPATTT